MKTKIDCTTLQNLGCFCAVKVCGWNFRNSLKYGVDQKKVRAELFICFSVRVYCCFIQKSSIDNDCECDF